MQIWPWVRIEPTKFWPWGYSANHCTTMSAILIVLPFFLILFYTSRIAEQTITTLANNNVRETFSATKTFTKSDVQHISHSSNNAGRQTRERTTTENCIKISPVYWNTLLSCISYREGQQRRIYTLQHFVVHQPSDNILNSHFVIHCLLGEKILFFMLVALQDLGSKSSYRNTGPVLPISILCN